MEDVRDLVADRVLVRVRVAVREMVRERDCVLLDVLFALIGEAIEDVMLDSAMRLAERVRVAPAVRVALFVEMVRVPEAAVVELARDPELVAFGVLVSTPWMKVAFADG